LKEKSKLLFKKRKSNEEIIEIEVKEFVVISISKRKREEWKQRFLSKQLIINMKRKTKTGINFGHKIKYSMNIIERKETRDLNII
jgi:hypothetical protein